MHALNTQRADTKCAFVKDVNICLNRIAERVKLGGHSVAEPTVRRRFTRCGELFATLYKDLADSWYVFDNSGEKARLIAKKDNGEEQILDRAFYGEIFANG